MVCLQADPSGKLSYLAYTNNGGFGGGGGSMQFDAQTSCGTPVATYAAGMAPPHYSYSAKQLIFIFFCYYY